MDPDPSGVSHTSKQQDKGTAQAGTKLNYTFWESAEVLFREHPKTHSVVGRWDWHLWQIFVALLPSVAVYQFVRIARSDLAAADAAVAEAEAAAAKEKQPHRNSGVPQPQPERHAETVVKSQPQQDTETQPRQAAPANDKQRMIERLDELDALMKSLRSDLEHNSSDKAAVPSAAGIAAESATLRSQPPPSAP